MLITRPHHARNPAVLALLKLVNQRGQCSAAELYAQFCQDLANGQERRRLALRLSYLVMTEQLCRQGRGQTAQYWLGLQAGAPTGRAATRPPGHPPLPDLPPYVSQFANPTTTPAPSYNSMAAPPWVPPPGPALRPGALDYQRYASHGHRC